MASCITGCGHAAGVAGGVRGGPLGHTAGLVMPGRLQASVPASPGRWRPHTASAGHSPAVKPDTGPGRTRWQAFAFLSAERIPWPSDHLGCFCQGRSTWGCARICIAACPVLSAFLRVWPGCRGWACWVCSPCSHWIFSERIRILGPARAGVRGPGSNPAHLSRWGDLGQVTSALYTSASCTMKWEW